MKEERKFKHTVYEGEDGDHDREFGDDQDLGGGDSDNSDGDYNRRGGGSGDEII